MKAKKEAKNQEKIQSEGNIKKKGIERRREEKTINKKKRKSGE